MSLSVKVQVYTASAYTSTYTTDFAPTLTDFARRNCAPCIRAAFNNAGRSTTVQAEANKTARCNMATAARRAPNLIKGN